MVYVRQSKVRNVESEKALFEHFKIRKILKKVSFTGVLTSEHPSQKKQGFIFYKSRKLGEKIMSIEH